MRGFTSMIGWSSIIMACSTAPCWHHPEVLEAASEFGDPYQVLAPVSHEAHGSGTAW